MDDSHFDAVTRHLSRLSGRRALLGALTALPLASGLGDILSPDEVDADGRRKRRVKRHKHGKGRRKPRKNRKKKPRCTPEAASQTCAGRCGSVTNNCQQVVECEPCCTLTPTDDLQDAIDAAADGATLRLCAGTWVVPETLVIAKPLTIIGAGAEETILDGDDARRVLGITGDVEVTLQALTITRGNDTSGDGGGGIYNDATLTLRDIRLTGNTSPARGGGIYNIQGSLTLESGSLVQGNTGYFGGGIATQGGTVTLASGSTVDTNTGFLGGGVFSAGGTVNLAGGSAVQGNEAEAGGGIYASSASVTLASGSIVQGNTASDGGGIYATAITTTLASGSIVQGNTATDRGGGVFNSGGTMTVEDGALVCNNSAPQCFGAIGGACPNPPSGVCPA